MNTAAVTLDNKMELSASVSLVNHCCAVVCFYLYSNNIGCIVCGENKKVLYQEQACMRWRTRDYIWHAWTLSLNRVPEEVHERSDILTRDMCWLLAYMESPANLVYGLWTAQFAFGASQRGLPGCRGATGCKNIENECWVECAQTTLRYVFWHLQFYSIKLPT